MSITAKIICHRKESVGDGQTVLGFGPDYDDGRNKEWSKYTPSLSLSMQVLDSVAEHFSMGQAFTLTFDAAS